jgi:6-pyruvoyltetrahydropterin/6-carboxytetrahydropterin synthase
MNKLATIELYREDLNFSAGHFTIFSATEREKLHGHNYQIHAAITTLVPENGLRFDYRYYHNKIKEVCQELNLCFLLPTESQYLKIEDAGQYYHAHFNQEVIPFLKADVRLIPIANTTVEELSHWFIGQLTQDKIELEKNAVQTMTIKIASNAGRAGSATWSK